MTLGAILIDVFMTRLSGKRGTKTDIADSKLFMRGAINKSRNKERLGECCARDAQPRDEVLQ